MSQWDLMSASFYSFELLPPRQYAIDEWDVPGLYIFTAPLFFSHMHGYCVGQ